MSDEVTLRSRFAVDDEALSELHAVAFGNQPGLVQPWGARLERHSLTWVGAFDGERLVGFVHACWDGGAHAFLLDAVVRPGGQRRGVGRRLVERLVTEVGAAGCEWLHVDHEARYTAFYRACGFSATEAGLLHLLEKR